MVNLLYYINLALSIKVVKIFSKKGKIFKEFLSKMPKNRKEGKIGKYFSRKTLKIIDERKKVC
jgi:hypothetical protein